MGTTGGQRKLGKICFTTYVPEIVLTQAIPGSQNSEVLFPCSWNKEAGGEMRCLPRTIPKVT